MRRSGLNTLVYLIAVVVFLIVSTYAVLYATGYKIDWQALTIKKTGFMLIETYPKGANIKIADKTTDKTTPETIKRLLPGNYHIELTKDSYHPWQGDIKVASGLVTENRNILLTLEDLKPTILLDQPVTRLRANADNTKIALLVEGKIYLWDVKNKQSVSIVDAALIRQQIKLRNTNEIARGNLNLIGFAPDNQTILFISTTPSNQYYLTIDTTSGIIKLIATGRNFIDWQWWSNSELLYTQNNKLYLLNLTTNQPKLLLSEAAFGYHLQDNNLYAAVKTKAGDIAFTEIDKSGTTKPLFNLPEASEYSFSKIKLGWLVTATQGTIASLWLEEKANGISVLKNILPNIEPTILWDDTYLIYLQDHQLMSLEWELLNKPDSQPVKITSLYNSKLTHFSFDTILYIQNQTLKSVDLTGKNKYDLLPIVLPENLIISEPQMSQLIFIDALGDHRLTEATLREKTTTFF